MIFGKNDKRYVSIYGIRGRKLPTFELQNYNLINSKTVQAAYNLKYKWKGIIHQYC